MDSQIETDKPLDRRERTSDLDLASLNIGQTNGERKTERERQKKNKKD